MTFSRFRAS